MKKLFSGILIGIILTFSVSVLAESIFQESQFTLYVNGVKIEQPMYMKDWVNYIPLRATTEALGANIEVKDSRIDVFFPSPTPLPPPEPILTDIEAVAKKCKDSCVMIYTYSQVTGGTKQNQGSGFVYNGFIVTAAHVVEGAETIDIYLDDKVTGIRGTIHYLDPKLDIAIIKARTGLSSVTLGDSDELREGQNLIAITSPSGLQNCIDECINSGLAQYDTAKFLTITESDMDNGSSGGAIFNIKGEVIGIVNGGAGKGIGAIPINDIEPILNKLR